MRSLLIWSRCAILQDLCYLFNGGLDSRGHHASVDLKGLHRGFLHRLEARKLSLTLEPLGYLLCYLQFDRLLDFDFDRWDQLAECLSQELNLS